MTTVPADKLTAFVAGAHRVAAHGLVRCSSGNLSCRLDEELMLIKSSRSWMADLTTEQIALCRLDNGATLNGVTPSVEHGFHSGILRERRDVNVVLHFQTPAATAIACRAADEVNFFVLPEIPYYIGPVGFVPYLAPGSRELAEAVVTAMRTHDMVMLRNHGQVTVGRDWNDAIQKAVLFELACDVMLRAGDRLVPIPSAGIEEQLRARAAKGQTKSV